MSKGKDTELKINEYNAFVEQYKKLGLFPLADKAALNKNDVLDKVKELDSDDSIPTYDTSWTVFDKNFWSR